MKESGMDKLIELLNQFEETDNWENGYQVKFRESKIISKKFGFIKWLVDNDKIDRTYRKDLKYPYYIDDKERDLKGYEKSDLLVMLCSIQNNPIEFLLSILK